METHQCKLCTRNFLSGKALGGHMRSHMFPLPIPPKHQLTSVCVYPPTESIPYSLKENKEIIQGKDLFYELRENPKKSHKLVDNYKFLETGSGLYFQESETESRNPTRRRSTRTRELGMEVEYSDVEVRKVKLKKLGSTESVTESEVVSSSSFEEEDAASCLMMLSRDKWKLNPVSQTRRRYQCESCDEVFESFEALGGHRTSHKKVKKRLEQEEHDHEEEKSWEEKPRKRSNNGKKNMHVCKVCSRVFGSGQALGGHKRTHLMGSSSTSFKQQLEENGKNLGIKGKDENFGLSLIDLNLPAPMEDGLIESFKCIDAV